MHAWHVDRSLRRGTVESRARASRSPSGENSIRHAQPRRRPRMQASCINRRQVTTASFFERPPAESPWLPPVHVVPTMPTDQRLREGNRPASARIDARYRTQPVRHDALGATDGINGPKKTPLSIAGSVLSETALHRMPQWPKEAVVPNTMHAPVPLWKCRLAANSTRSNFD